MKKVLIGAMLICCGVLYGQSTPSPGLFITSIDVDGQGRFARISPGATFLVTFSYTIWDLEDPGTNILWISVGVERSGGGIDAQDAVGPLLPGEEGKSGTATISLAAPTREGVYAIDFAVAAVSEKYQALSSFERLYNGFWPDQGAIIVKQEH